MVQYLISKQYLLLIGSVFILKMIESVKEVWHGPTMVQISNYAHRYFFRFFLDSEVGHFWAILNGMLSTFTLGFLALYAMKVRNPFDTSTYLMNYSYYDRYLPTY